MARSDSAYRDHLQCAGDSGPVADDADGRAARREHHDCRDRAVDHDLCKNPVGIQYISIAAAGDNVGAVGISQANTAKHAI